MTRFRTVAVPAAIIVAGLVSGCTTTRQIAVKPEFKFTLAPEAKRGPKLVLFVDAETRQYNVEQRKSVMGSTTIYKVGVGSVLSQAATQALQTSFPGVRAVDSLNAADPGQERVLQIRFGPQTTAKLGKTTVSAQLATIQLVASVYSPDKKPVWETTVTETREGRKAGSAAAGALIGGLIGGSMSQKAYDGALEMAVREALQAALETLVARLEAQLQTPPRT